MFRGRRRHGTAFEDLVAELRTASRQAVVKSVKQGARQMADRAMVKGSGDGSAAFELRCRKRRMRHLGCRGRIGYDPNRLMALRQAYVAARLVARRRRRMSNGGKKSGGEV